MRVAHIMPGDQIFARRIANRVPEWYLVDRRAATDREDHVYFFATRSKAPRGTRPELMGFEVDAVERVARGDLNRVVVGP